MMTAMAILILILLVLYLVNWLLWHDQIQVLRDEVYHERTARRTAEARLEAMRQVKEDMVSKLHEKEKGK